jgi:hypothetical protein
VGQALLHWLYIHFDCLGGAEGSCGKAKRCPPGEELEDVAVVQRVHRPHLQQHSARYLDNSYLTTQRNRVRLLVGCWALHSCRSRAPAHLLEHARLLRFVDRLNGIVVDCLLLAALVNSGVLAEAYLLVDAAGRGRRQTGPGLGQRNRGDAGPCIAPWPRRAPALTGSCSSSLKRPSRSPHERAPGLAGPQRAVSARDYRRCLKVGLPCPGIILLALAIVQVGQLLNG